MYPGKCHLTPLVCPRINHYQSSTSHTLFLTLSMPPRRQATGISIAFVLLCALFLLINNTYTILPPQQSPNMPITHIVMFQFKSGISADVVKDVCLLQSLQGGVGISMLMLIISGLDLHSYAGPQRQLSSSSIPETIHHFINWWSG